MLPFIHSRNFYKICEQTRKHAKLLRVCFDVYEDKQFLPGKKNLWNNKRLRKINNSNNGRDHSRYKMEEKLPDKKIE